MEVEVHTIRNCGHCKEAKAYLTKKGISFKEIDMSQGGVSEIQEKKRWFKEMGLKTYPVTIIYDNISDKNGILQGFNKEDFDEVFGK